MPHCLKQSVFFFQKTDKGWCEVLVDVKGGSQEGKEETPFHFVLSPGKTAASIAFLKVGLSICVIQSFAKSQFCQIYLKRHDFLNKFDKTVIFLAFIPHYVSLFHQNHNINTTQFEKWRHLKVFFLCLFVGFIFVFCLLIFVLFFSFSLTWRHAL